MKNPRPVSPDTDLSIAEDPSPADIAALDDAIHAFNVEATGIDDGRLLAILLRDAGGEVYAGLHGHTWGGCCEIKVLWIAPTHRGSGLGTRLLQAAEREAARRGCRQVVLTSHSFQAPGFYEKHGYRRLAAIEGYPAGHAQVVLTKRLGGQSQQQEIMPNF